MKKVWHDFKSFHQTNKKKIEGLKITARNEKEALKLAKDIYVGKVWVEKIK